MKDDKKHRSEWRLLYSDNELEEFRSFTQHCISHGASFCYAISPGLDFKFNLEKDMYLIFNM